MPGFFPYRSRYVQIANAYKRIGLHGADRYYGRIWNENHSKHRIYRLEDIWTSPGSREKGMNHTRSENVLRDDKLVKHGVFKKWNNRGFLVESGEYKDGERSGKWRRRGWEISGWEVGDYRQGKKHGIWHEWSSPDEKNKAWECQFDNGKIIGDKKYYDRGKLQGVETYDKKGCQIRSKTYHENGKLASDTELKCFIKHGFSTTYDDSGKIEKRGKWKKGEPWSGWCYILAAGDAGSWGGLGKYVEYKRGKPVK